MRLGKGEAEAKALAGRLSAALGPGWRIASEPMRGRGTPGRVLVKLNKDGRTYCLGWSWTDMLESFCWKSSLPFGRFELPVEASSVEELELKLAALGA